MPDLKKEILYLISQSPNPISVSDMETVFRKKSIDANRRAIQRALSDLVSENMVNRTGLGPATVYEAARDNKNIYQIPISGTSSELLSYLSLPIIKRRPVTYDQSILFDYEPNISFLLPLEIREQLHDMGRTGPNDRPAGTFLRDILGRLLIDLSWASSKLEGNTYTLLDTQRLIEEGLVAEGKDRIETVMILNHKAAIEMIAESPEDIGMNRMTFLNLHAFLSDGLLRDQEASGRLRRRPVDITGSVYTPTAVPQRIEECFDRILYTASQIQDPFEASFFLLIHIPYLQPFEDVNKRVARVGANIPLIKSNVSPLSFIDMPEDLYLKGIQAFYETGHTDLIQDVYLAAYDRSCQRYAAISKDMVEPDPFRMRWRKEIFNAVRAFVLSGEGDIFQLSDDFIPKDVSKDDEVTFQGLVEIEIQELHAGNFMRYGLRQSEFEKWDSLRRNDDDGSGGGMSGGPM